MKDLRSRWNRNLLAVLLTFNSMLVCSALPGQAQVNRGSTSLVASDSSMDFGTVAVGGSAAQANYIFNSTNANVTIGKAITSGSYFQLVSPGLPVTIPPGQRAKFVFSFVPNRTGSLPGTIAIWSSVRQSLSSFRDSGEDVTLMIPVAGVGAEVGSSGSTSLVASDSSMDFGTVAVGGTAAQANYIFNPTNANVTIGKAITSGSYFQLVSPGLPVTIPPGQRAKFVFSFVPNRRGRLHGTIVIWSSARQSTMTVSVSGTAVPAGNLGQLVAAPGSLSFGSLLAGNPSQSKPLVLTNSGTASVNITQAAATGAGYRLSGPSLPLTLKAGGAANFSVTFAPQSAGPANGNVLIQSTAGNPTVNIGLTATVTASSLGKLTVSSSPVLFGTVAVGKTQQQSATITNSGGTSVTVSQETVTGTGFSASVITMPMTLSPNQSATVSLNCTPKLAGSMSGNLTISSNASNGTVAVPLSAMAVMPGDLIGSAASLSFGNVQVGKTQSLPETLTNSGGSNITLAQAAAGAGFSISGLSLPITLAAGKSTSFNVVFAPQATGSSNVNLAIISNGPTPTLTIPLSGAGIAAGSLTASSVSFGGVQVGSSSTHTATLTNPGGSSVTISQANLTGNGFSMSGLSTPLTLPAGQNFTFNVAFAPQAAGAASGNIAIVSTASGSAPSIALSGIGTSTGQFSINQGSFAFGSITVGANKSLPVTLSATGSSVTVNSASVSSAEFTLTGPALPLTIPAGGTTSFSLMFSPQSSGAATASISFVTSASATPLSKAVTGMGAAVTQHSVDLAWSASSSTVAGYNIYRGSTTGGPYAKLNSSADGTLAYTDSSVQAGQTYFYTTTALASDGSESAHSNEVKAVVPTP